MSAATDDRAARLAATRTMGAWWSAHPAMVHLRARLDALGTEPEAQELLAAAQPLLENLTWVRDAIGAGTRAMVADPWFEPPFRPLDPDKQRGLALYDDRRLRITIQTVPLERIAAHKASTGEPRSVGFTGADARYRVIAAAGTRLDLWEAEPAGENFVTASAGRCRRAGRIELADGMIFTIDGARQAWTIARQRGDLAMLQAVARRRLGALAIEYDATTGNFIGASATDGAVARMQLMASLLRLMGRRDAAPAVAVLAKDGPFFLRWHMARELAALDASAAAPLLRQMADADPHDEIRAVARHTLGLLAA